MTADTDSIRYKLETFFFGIASQSMKLGDGMASVEQAEADGQQMTDDLYEMLAREGYQIVPVHEPAPTGHYHG